MEYATSRGSRVMVMIFAADPLGRGISGQMTCILKTRGSSSASSSASRAWRSLGWRLIGESGGSSSQGDTAINPRPSKSAERPPVFR
jgi:hypothetical protein